MKAMVIESFGGSEKIHLKEVEKPTPKEGEVLIKVAYAGVNPVDWKIREGFLAERLPHFFPLILGWDVSGTIEALGKGVSNLQVGESVVAYARKPIVQWGTYAEYVAVEALHTVKKPNALSSAQAAAIPLVGLTAWQSLFDAAQLKKGEKVLIHGASGAVGALAVQFAKIAGAFVIGTASPKKHDYVQSLGADQVLDYKEPFEAALQGSVDVVFDAVGGEMFTRSLSCLKKGGRIVSLLEHLDEAEARRRGITAHYVFVKPNGVQLAEIMSLIEQKEVVPLPVEEMPLQEAAQAQDKLRAGIFGKIVLKI